MELMSPLLLFALATLLPQALVLSFQSAQGDAFYDQLLEDLTKEPNQEVLDRFKEDPGNMYYLFTRENPDLAQLLTENDAASISSSNFDPNVPTVFTVHGWLSDRNSGSNPTITKALLESGSVNVIVVDWSTLSKYDYLTSARGVPSVGRSLGQFVAFLSETTGISYDSVHLVGFSLGAHVVGVAGRQLGGQITRITGLDPAGPYWYGNSESLRNTDARYVEVIHTNAGFFGIEKAIGDADFFPNGGSSQPDCHNVLCNHNRSWQLFAASINYNHLVGRQCSTTFQLFSNLCRGKSMVMGNNDLNKYGTGVYRLTTGRHFPF